MFEEVARLAGLPVPVEQPLLDRFAAVCGDLALESHTPSAQTPRAPQLSAPGHGFCSARTPPGPVTHLHQRRDRPRRAAPQRTVQQPSSALVGALPGVPTPATQFTVEPSSPKPMAPPG